MTLACMRSPSRTTIQLSDTLHTRAMIRGFQRARALDHSFGCSLSCSRAHHRNSIPVHRLLTQQLHTYMTTIDLAGDSWLLSCTRDARLEPCQHYRHAPSEDAAVTPIIDVRASVPGCVHVDLLRAGVIDEMYKGFNEQNQTWIAYSDWEYRREFELDASVLSSCADYVLEFQSLDTIGMPLARSLSCSLVGDEISLARRIIRDLESNSVLCSHCAGERAGGRRGIEHVPSALVRGTQGAAGVAEHSYSQHQHDHRSTTVTRNLCTREARCLELSDSGSSAHDRMMDRTFWIECACLIVASGVRVPPGLAWTTLYSQDTMFVRMGLGCDIKRADGECRSRGVGSRVAACAGPAFATSGICDGVRLACFNGVLLQGLALAQHHSDMAVEVVLKVKMLVTASHERAGPLQLHCEITKDDGSEIDDMFGAMPSSTECTVTPDVQHGLYETTLSISIAWPGKC
mgnify:FL=1